MALKTKVDPFSIAATGIELTDTAENRSISTAEAQGPDGFVVAVESFGERQNPSADYVVTGNSVTLSSVVLGGISTIGSGQNAKRMALGNISIKTSAGAAPTISASGQQVEDTASVSGCTVTLGSLTISGLHHAQELGFFTLTNGQLTDATVTFSCGISNAEVDGVIKAHDLNGGKVTVTGNIVAIPNGSTYTTPTVTLSAYKTKAGAFTTPVTETNGNGTFPTYTFTAEWPLAADVATTVGG